MDRLPWQRQKGESRKAFEAFGIYRDMGPTRSLQRVKEKLSKSYTIIARWSSRWGWVERTAAWDEELDRRGRESQIEERKEMAKRHINEAMVFQQKVLERMRQLNPNELSPNDMARWFEIAVKVERLSRGEATENVKQEVKGQVDINDDITKRIINDPGASALAHELLEKLAQNQSGSDGIPCKPGEVDPS